MRRARKVYAVGFVYLDAANCDSTISYKIVKGRRISGNIAFCLTVVEKSIGTLARMTEE